MDYNLEESREQIKILVNNFNEHVKAYKTNFNETNVRTQFIDKFFHLLGWDVYNKNNFSEQFRDVIPEDKIRINSVTKAPDYSFRIGGTRVFFVEAKKPAVDIKHDKAPAFQLRRYGWTAKLSVSILTDFEELSVYDCHVKPNPNDKAHVARRLYYTYDEYVEKWDEIYSLFSKEAVMKGSIEKFISAKKKIKGTAKVDDEFLKEISEWRILLAKNIALRNSNLSTRELNFAVQRTIDRIIFLRMCEDRGVENFGRLLSITNGTRIYPLLFELFREADQKYNSGLFYFKKEKGRLDTPDELSDRIDIDDKIIKSIIKRLYPPDCPYEFSVMPADILGNVYEQFLGKVIRLTPGHQAKIEDKPEVKKAGGVYYTPKYIVDYIVENTVGKALNSKIANPKSKILKIIDPACGSGSFLIQAYQFLLNWHLDWYTKNDPQKWMKGKNPVIYEAKIIDNNLNIENYYKLTTSEKKRILLDHIYGVDIDSQAVEVTKLSLLLKVLEDENQDTLESQLKLFHERALPDLSQNIKCGNSLIGPDFYENQQLDLLDEEEQLKINVFDWQSAFPDVFNQQNPGFDVVIGNPPYSMQIPKIQQEYFLLNYKNQDYQKDLYLLFLERYEKLLRKTALLGIIISNTWLQSINLRKIRKYLTEIYEWLRILHLPDKVFKAVVDTHVLIFKKSENNTKELVVDIRKDGDIKQWHKLPWSVIPKTGDPINIVAPFKQQELYNKICTISIPLKDVTKVYNGVKPFEKGKGKPPQTADIMKEKPFVKQGEKPDDKWTPLLRGSLIDRYQNKWKNNYWILYGPWLAAPRKEFIFDAEEKIMVRQTGDSIKAVLIKSGFIGRDNLHIILSNDNLINLKFILAIINSRLINFSYSIMNPEKGEALAQVKKRHVELLPIPNLNLSNPTDKKRHLQMTKYVDRMLELYKRFDKVKTPYEKTNIQNQISATDKAIDKLVYELYELTEEEIKIVEKLIK